MRLTASTGVSTNGASRSPNGITCIDRMRKTVLIVMSMSVGFYNFRPMLRVQCARHGTSIQIFVCLDWSRIAYIPAFNSLVGISSDMSFHINDQIRSNDQKNINIMKWWNGSNLNQIYTHIGAIWYSQPLKSSDNPIWWQDAVPAAYKTRRLFVKSCTVWRHN